MSNSGVSEQQTDEFREFVKNRKEFLEYMKEKSSEVPGEGDRAASPQRKQAGKNSGPEGAHAPGAQA